MKKSLFSGKLIIIIFCIVAAFAGLFIFFKFQKKSVQPPVINSLPENKIETPEIKLLGLSFEGRKIEAYNFGKGENHLVFVGGIHGGYEWNTVLLAYKFIDYLNDNKKSLPENLKITVIPVLNPDGLFKIIGKEGRFDTADIPAGTNGEGRFNAKGVDLNRNFDCKWKSKGVWGQREVNCGNGPFSEPESMALKNFISENRPATVIFWHSKSNGIYASYCQDDVLEETIKIMNVYSKASGYPIYETFQAYEVTGDAADWLASIRIPAITVELKTHEKVEWDENLAGIKALLEYYENKK